MSNGVIATPARPGLDFGPGFYLTTSKEQAKIWANKSISKYGRGTSALVGFIVFYKDMSMLRSVSYVRANRDALEYWKFVSSMKSGLPLTHYAGGSFDLVSGPLAVRPGKFFAIPNSDQFSFHGQDGLSYINGCKRTLLLAPSGGKFS